MKRLNRVGEKHTTKSGCELKIVEYLNNYTCTVEFEDGTLLKNIEYSKIKNRSIKNPNHPSVCGIGYTGQGKYVTSKNKKRTAHYLCWRGMITRCYSEKYHKIQPTYKGCIVTSEWHNFQNFAKWFEENYKPEIMQGWQLDKDILIKGNKIYSPETCCFVPQEINNLFPNKPSKRGKYPVGIRKVGNVFQTTTSKNSNLHYLGTFNTPEEAFQAYKTAKEQYIKEVADKWRGKITEQVYNALINYKIEITD